MVLMIAAVLCRFNLPAKPISSNLDLPELEKKEWVIKAAGGIFIHLLVTDAVAGWEYIDLGVVRIANSNRLNARAVGLPFCKWRLYSKDKQK